MVTGEQIAEALAETLRQVNGLRVWSYMPDDFLPPGAVVAQPTLILDDPQVPFCTIKRSYPVFVVVARSSERVAQQEIQVFVEAALAAIEEDPDLGGVVQLAQVTQAQPGSVAAGGTDYPSYTINVNVIA